jgi:putative transferase (TIGR04331 family)
MKFSKWKKEDQRLNLNFTQINSNHKQIETSYKNILEILTKVLNDHHNLKNKKSFWKIIIGSWLLSFICVAHCEYLKKYKKKKNNLILEPNNSYSEFNSSITNEKFRYNLFKAINSNINTIKLINKKQVTSNFSIYSLCSLGFDFFRSFFIKIKISFKIDKISYKTDYKIKYLLKIASLKKENLNKKIRIKIKNKISENKTHSEFIKSLLNIIHWYIPINYLENFKNINKFFEKKTFHSNTFFVTHSHVTDDVFKIFSANWKASNKNNKLNIIQHGGGYGIYRVNLNDMVEISLGDNFFGWGTYNNYYNKDKYIPFFMNKENKYVDLDSSNEQNKILIIAKDLMRFDFGTTDVHPNTYIKIYKELINWLEIEKSNQFDLRLYGSRKMLSSKTSHLNFYYKIINKVVKKKYLISNDVPIKETLNNYGLTLHTYFGTAFYETLSINFPSIIFIDKSVKRIYSTHFLQSIKFAENKIIFYDKKKLKNFLKSKSFRKKWYSKKNQDTVKKLQNKICRITDKKTYLLSINKKARRL